ncbi:MAG: hypothetical protein ABI383_06075 [Acidobacteriaceae bacterium]
MKLHALLIGVIAALTLCCTCFAQDAYTSLGFKYIYTNAEGATGQYTSFNGWNFVPTLHLTKRFGIHASISGLYGWAHENVHGYLGGVDYSFPNSTRFTPVVYTEAGVARSSKPAAIAHAFEYDLGVLFAVKLNKHVNLIIAPLEYAVTTPSGGPRNNYVASFGFSFPIGKQKK